MANKNFRVKHGLEVAGSATIDNDLTVTGNLTVNGDTTTLNTATLSVEDNIVILNSGVTGTPSLNAGIEVERGDSTNTVLRWNETTDKWQFTNDGSTYYDMVLADTTYTQNASTVSGGANLNLVGSDSTTDSIKLNSGTGVTVSRTDADTVDIAIGQAVGTTDDVVFNTVDSNIVDANYVVGQLYATRNTSYVPPTSPLTTVTGTNGIVAVSSTGGANGYGAGVSIRYHIGDTTAGGNTAAALSMSNATGTSSSPAGTGTNLVLGTVNFDGYTTGTSNNYASQIATTNQGAGTSAIQPLQAQGYARQNFVNSTTVTTAVTGASGTGSVATLTFTTQNTAPYVVGQTVTVSGMTPSGYNGTVVITAATTSSISYANATTGFTSGGTIGAANTVTAAGTGFRVRGFANSTNLSVANRINFMDLTASAAAFKAASYTFSDEVITGSTLTSRTYLTLNSGSANFASGGTTYANLASGGSTITAANGINNFIRTGTVNTTQPALLVRYSRTDTTGSNDNDGVDFRLGTGGTSTTNNIARVDAQYKSTGLHTIGLSVSNDNFAADTDTIYRGQADKTVLRATPTGTTGTASDIVTVESTKVTMAVPVAFPVYTKTQAAALTGAAGWQICISDSAQGANPNGMMAFWDTTNSRWSYIHDNSAV